MSQEYLVARHRCGCMVQMLTLVDTDTRFIYQATKNGIATWKAAMRKHAETYGEMTFTHEIAPIVTKCETRAAGGQCQYMTVLNRRRITNA